MTTKITLAIGLLFSFVSCVGQETKKVDYALYAGVMASRATDFITTEQVLNRGGHEDILPSGLVHSTPAFALYEFGTGAFEIYFAHKLRKTHPLLARSILLFDISLATGVSAHNASIPRNERR